MPSQAEIDDGDRYINSYFGDRGGIFIPPDHPGDFLKALENHARRLCDRVSRRLTTPVYIHFRFVADLELQAIAGTMGTFVTANVGLAIALKETFDRMLCEPTIFPGVGRPELERPRGHYRIIRGAVMSMDDGQASVPNCPVRRWFSHILKRTAFEFVVGHELAHISCNHFEIGGCGIATPTTGMIEEIRDEARFGGMDNQGMELQADTLALFGALELADNAVVSLMSQSVSLAISTPTQQEAHAEAYGTFQRGLFTVMFAVFVFFDLLDRSRHKGSGLETGSHPPPSVRSQVVSGVAADSVWQIPYFKLDELEAVQAVAAPLRAAAHAVAVCTQGRDRFVLLEDDPVATAYFERLANHAMGMSEELWKASWLSEKYRWPKDPKAAPLPRRT